MARRSLLAAILLMPLAPLFGWGPLAHPVINRRALRKARERKGSLGSEAQHLVDLLSKNEDLFCAAGNSADCISAHHVLSGVTIYDYAHNSMPDTAAGTQHFGYTLLDTHVSGGKWSNRDLVIACGWLAHQLADWWPHYACVDRNGEPCEDPTAEPDNMRTFSGYADSHRILGVDYPPEILTAYGSLDHGLLELFHDALLLDDAESCLAGDPVGLFPGTDGNLLTATSERYRGKCCRIPPEHIEPLKENFCGLVNGMKVLLYVLFMMRPDLKEVLRSELQGGGKPDYLERAVDKVVQGLFELDVERVRGLVSTGLKGEGVPRLEGARRVPGSPLFAVARQLGRLDVEVLRDFVQTGTFELYFSLPWLKPSLKCRVGRLGASSMGATVARKALDAVLSGDKSKEPVTAYLAALSRPGRTLEEARNEFKAKLRPVVVVEGVPVGADPGEKLCEMLRGGEIRVRIVAAVCNTDRGGERDSKRLDLSTLLFRIDGYDVRGEGDRFELISNEDPENLQLTCKIRTGALTRGDHHVFVGITDRSGVAAKYLDYEVPLEVREAELTRLQAAAAPPTV